MFYRLMITQGIMRQEPEAYNYMQGEIVEVAETYSGKGVKQNTLFPSFNKI